MLPTWRAELAPRIAPIVFANITTRYPYHDAHLFRFGDEPLDPTLAHPAFGNSFDWHSSVHSHWTALQLLAEPLVLDAERLRDAIARNLTAENLAVEAAYLEAHPSYERPYGWAWFLVLAATAETWPGAPCRELALLVSKKALRWLDTLPAPIRHGVHSNTAFAMGLMLDASRETRSAELEGVLIQRAAEWFGNDRAYPAAWERSGYDFLSPGLAEADLMRRVLPLERFRAWWRDFLTDESGAALYDVAEVPDVSDGQIVHLHGLNLSRAGMVARIAAALGADERNALLAHADRLYRASIAAAFGDEYLSTHWLPTFAWHAASSIDAAHRQHQLQ